MVLVGDFNKEVTGLLKSKYPTEKERLLELNLSSSSRNPSFNYSVSSLTGGNGASKTLSGCEGSGVCCGGGGKTISGASGGRLFALDGSSTLKWSMFSTQLETKMDMNGLSILEARASSPGGGLSLSSKYERSSKGSSSGLGNLEIGGDIQRERFQSRLRVSPSLECLGCVNKLNKENKGSIGMMLSNTVTLRPFSCMSSSLSLGAMISSPDVGALPYNRSSTKLVMGLMIKGPFYVKYPKELASLPSQGVVVQNKRQHYGFGDLSPRMEDLAKSAITTTTAAGSGSESGTESPNYILSLQTNTSGGSNGHNCKISGFTGGLLLNNLAGNRLTLGMMVSYNALGGGGIGGGGSPQSLVTSNGGGGSDHSAGGCTQTEESCDASCSRRDYYKLTRFSDKVQYSIGGKVSFGSMGDRYSGILSKGSGSSEFGLSGEDCGQDSSKTTANITTTDLRFKMMNNFKMAYSLTYRFTRSLSATFGAQVDPKKLGTCPDSIKYGFILDMTA